MDTTFLTTIFNELKTEIEAEFYTSVSVARVELSIFGQIPCSQVLSIIFKDYWNENNYGIDISFDLYKHLSNNSYCMIFSVAYGDGRTLLDWKTEILSESFNEIHVRTVVEDEIIPLLASNKNKLMEAIREFPNIMSPFDAT